MIFFDTESCGFHGPTVLIQWAKDDGPIKLHSVWTSPIIETMKLIESFCEETVVGFNLAFDWFHLCQTYTTLYLLAEKVGHDEEPQDHITDYALCEERARFVDMCLKPVNSLDLMLHARKGPYQSTMDRGDIRIKRVPSALAWELAKELDVRIPLKDVYFARKKDPKKRWAVYDCTDDLGEPLPELKDVVLKFAPSSALKALAVDALELDHVTVFSDIELPKKAMPEELGYAPFALALGKPGKWNGAWPDVIKMHISHWAYNDMARKYAEDDVRYTRDLYRYFKRSDIAKEYGDPAPGDDDSILACMVAAVRWKGFNIDTASLQKIRDDADRLIKNAKYNFGSSKVCRKYLEEVMSDVEKIALRGSTKGIVLEEIAKWKVEKVCETCYGLQACTLCEEGLIKTDQPHPAASRAQEILDRRRAKKKIELCDKLIKAGRFHASLKVIGALSFRMAGADGLNPQGIDHSKVVRACFKLADEDFVLCGGDFSGFEIVLMDAVYGDPDLRGDILYKRPCPDCKATGVKKGKPCLDCKGTGQAGSKIHAIFGTFLFKPLTYDQVLATKGLGGEKDKYDRSKKGVYAMAYGGEGYTLHTRVGVDAQVAEEAYQAWIKKYKTWGRERQKTFDLFCSMRQPGGLGTKVEWHEPAPYVESMFGFKRFFTLENMICKVLFELAEKPPKHWNDLKIKVTRRDREQTVCGAARSALLACAFATQASNMRAAGNHRIQSSGATITKKLQTRIWQVQPSGIHKWRTQPLNIHDEIMCPTRPEYVEQVQTIATGFVESLKDKIPLVEMEWSTGLKSWAEK
jgi:hypothetical protein